MNELPFFLISVILSAYIVREIIMTLVPSLTKCSIKKRK